MELKKGIVLVLALIVLFGLAGYSAAQDNTGSSASSSPAVSSPSPAPSAPAASSNNDNSGAVYVSYTKCKVCHTKEYEDFSKRNFSKAWKILKMRGEDTNPKCLACHTTGYGKPGGFVSEQKTPLLASKQCEACHGPGSKHAANPSDPAARNGMKLSGKKNVCIECHVCMSTHSSVEF